MASYSEHLGQARANLDFLKSTNFNSNDKWDWQVTICFYIAVHLVNAHIANKANQHYRTHDQVKQALNPYNPLSICKLSEKSYIAFEKLQNLSRRSRYLCNDNLADRDIKAFLTYDRHLTKALNNLDILMHYISAEYTENFHPISLDCIELKGSSLSFFKYSSNNNA